MKKLIFAVLIIFLFLSGAFQAQAQSSTSSNSAAPSPNAFDTTGFPQWVKDLRRWDIITFGVYPFALFFTTTVADLISWNNANGMNMYDRRYAPWPLKSAGAIEMTNDEFGRVLLQAAGVAAIIACTDLAIVLIKRNKERKRIESKPRSTAVIDINPYGEQSDGTSADDSSNNAPEKEETPESDKN
jgi:hypothetical protein